MAYNYVVTANRASAVNQSLVGNFTGPNDINLITAKLSRIEIHKVTSDGLKLVQEVGVYGRIEALLLFRPQGHDKDSLFMLTNKYHVAILECIEGPQQDSFDIITRRSGNIADPASRPAETGNIVIIDPDCKMIGLRLYDGLFKVIPIDRMKTEEIEAFNIRMEEIVVPDITFLHGFRNPTIGFIYKDHSGSSHVKTYEVSLKEKEFILGPWAKENVANEANMIIPVPQQKFGGAIIVALESIVYINGDKERVIAPPLIKQSPIVCYTKIDKDGKRYLLGDLSGRLFCLILEESDYRPTEVSDMKLELLGEISIPQCITYLDNGIVYVGSKLGDSQLVRLLTEPDERGSFVQVCESYTNLGPIVDMCLVDLEKQGQGQLVTCSGHLKDGSLRIIRNGIGINEHSSMELPDIKGVWSLKIGKNQIKDNHLLLTFIKDSYLWLCEDGGDFENISEEDGFERNERTVMCTNVAHERIIQITRHSVILISSVTKKRIDIWNLPRNEDFENFGIYKVSSNQQNIVCADGDTLYLLEITPNKLSQVWKRTMEAQIACLDLTPLDYCNQLLAVGFWFNMNIVIYEIPTLKELYREELNSDMIPRSIITAKFEDSYYLLCALGDGSVYYFNLNPTTGALTNCKKVTLGTYETILRRFKSQSTTSIFACSDRPTVIYSSNNKLVFSNVNLKEVNYMCSLDTNCYSESLALVSDSDILFGTIDEIQKLHIRTIPLHESPIKIAHQPSTQTFGLLTMRKDTQETNGVQPTRPSASTKAHSKSTALSMSTGAARPTGIACSDLMEIDTSSFLIINQHTFEVLHAHQFMPTEMANSILSTRLGETKEEYFVVGTAFVSYDEPEPKQGRLVVYKWNQDAGLQQVAELSIKGSPYSLCGFDGKFLAGVNASVNLVELNSRRDLHIECTYVNATMALYLKRKGHLILMGDLMRSMSLFSYKPLESNFEEVARDFNPAWMTEVEILDENTFLGAEHFYNIFVCSRDPSAINEHDRQQMNQIGLFHLGDSVNVFHPGSLVVQHPSESSVEVKKTTLFGTVEGVVGLILSIDESLFRRLDELQTAINRIVKSVGKIDHKEWRAFQGNKSSQPAIGFIDGDLVETFLDFSREQMEQVANDASCSVDYLVKMIEELSRLH